MKEHCSTSRIGSTHRSFLYVKCICERLSAMAFHVWVAYDNNGRSMLSVMYLIREDSLDAHFTYTQTHNRMRRQCLVSTSRCNTRKSGWHIDTSRQCCIAPLCCTVQLHTFEVVTNRGVIGPGWPAEFLKTCTTFKVRPAYGSVPIQH
jgi:hypothetical protein